MTEKFRFVVVGGGTAGIISASYLKSYWGNNADVVLLYDHSKPGIGVGESLTPIIYDYLNYVGISRDELVKNINATVKLGLKFKNWRGDNKEYIHSFFETNQTMSPFNYGPAYDIVNNQYQEDYTYDSFYFNNCCIPEDPYAVQSLHIDAVLFSKYVEDKFKDQLTIIDGTVSQVILQNDLTSIKHLILTNGETITGDFFIDASGFQSVLFKNLPATWVDKTKSLPLDRCIPNPVPWTFDKQPPYTTSEASDEGWILQVPLSNRWGTGYLYCSSFCSDEQAFSNFESFLNKNYNTSLNNTEKVLSFKSGYWREQWVGNTICVGLSSGFSEPLEATNIHHTIFQIMHFVNVFNFKVFNYDIKHYNRIMQDFYENVYLYLRFCYTNKRNDTEFWKYMYNNIPEDVKDLDEKIQQDILNDTSFLNSPMFGQGNFTKIANGLNKIDKDNYLNILKSRNAYGMGIEESNQFKSVKFNNRLAVVDHLEYIRRVKNSS